LDAEELAASLVPCFPCIDESRMKRPFRRVFRIGRAEGRD
jgi:hypothetical protein